MKVLEYWKKTTIKLQIMSLFLYLQASDTYTWNCWMTAARPPVIRPMLHAYLEMHVYSGIGQESCHLQSRSRSELPIAASVRLPCLWWSCRHAAGPIYRVQTIINMFKRDNSNGCFSAWNNFITALNGILFIDLHSNLECSAARRSSTQQWLGQLRSWFSFRGYFWVGGLFRWTSPVGP